MQSVCLSSEASSEADQGQTQTLRVLLKTRPAGQSRSKHPPELSHWIYFESSFPHTKYLPRSDGVMQMLTAVEQKKHELFRSRSTLASPSLPRTIEKTTPVRMRSKERIMVRSRVSRDHTLAQRLSDNEVCLSLSGASTCTKFIAKHDRLDAYPL